MYVCPWAASAQVTGSRPTPTGPESPSAPSNKLPPDEEPLPLEPELEPDSMLPPSSIPASANPLVRLLPHAPAITLHPRAHTAPQRTRTRIGKLSHCRLLFVNSVSEC
jgi:hypothetical protein